MVQHYRQHQRTIKVPMGDGNDYLAPAGYITRCGRVTDQSGRRPATTTDQEKVDCKLCLAGLRCSPEAEYKEKAGQIVPELPSFNSLQR